jgi:hypothetical protein
LIGAEAGVLEDEDEDAHSAVDAEFEIDGSVVSGSSGAKEVSGFLPGALEDAAPAWMGGDVEGDEGGDCSHSWSWRTEVRVGTCG